MDQGGGAEGGPSVFGGQFQGLRVIGHLDQDEWSRRAVDPDRHDPAKLREVLGNYRSKIAIGPLQVDLEQCRAS